MRFQKHFFEPINNFLAKVSKEIPNASVREVYTGSDEHVLFIVHCGKHHEVARAIQTRSEIKLGVFTGAKNRNDGHSLKTFQAGNQAKLREEVILTAKQVLEGAQKKIADQNDRVIKSRLIRSLNEEISRRLTEEGIAFTVSSAEQVQILLNGATPFGHLENTLRARATVQTRFRNGQAYPVIDFDQNTVTGLDSIVSFAKVLNLQLGEVTLSMKRLSATLG